MKYQMVFVDWDGTLSNSRFWDRWVGTTRYRLIQEELFLSARDMLDDWMCGRIPHRAVLQYLERQTGIPYAQLEDELRYSAEHMEFVDPELPDLIRQLRGHGTKVVVATDNMDTFRLWTIPALGLESLFDDVLVSDAVGALKGQIHSGKTSAFFGQYFHQNMIKPTDTVLIDNSEEARIVETFGMHFLHVTNNSSLTTHLRSLLQHRK